MYDSDIETQSIYLPQSIEDFKRNLRGRIYSLSLVQARQQLQICYCFIPEKKQDQVYLEKVAVLLKQKIESLETIKTIEKAINRSQRHLSILKGNISIIQVNEQQKKILSYRSSTTNQTDCTKQLDSLLNIINNEKQYELNFNWEDNSQQQACSTIKEEDSDFSLSEMLEKQLKSQSKNNFMKQKLKLNLGCLAIQRSTQ